MKLTPMSGGLLVNNAKQLKNISCSLGQWRPASLQALAFWFPSLFSGLVILLGHIEAIGKWPTVLSAAYLSLIPKPDTHESPMPTDYRPTSVLWAMYRLWSSTRFRDCVAWQESWAPQRMWGCRPQRGAEAFGLATALQLEEGNHDDSVAAGGICFDFRKCFDLIPDTILFAALQRRGLHPAVLLPLQGLYQHVKRVYRLRVFFLCFWWKSANGLVQGCTLSMIGVNSIVALVLEVAEVSLAEPMPTTLVQRRCLLQLRRSSMV